MLVICCINRMIGDLLRSFTINNTEAHYDMHVHLFSNLMRHNHEKFLENISKKEGCEVEITT